MPIPVDLCDSTSAVVPVLSPAEVAALLRTIPDAEAAELMQIAPLSLAQEDPDLYCILVTDWFQHRRHQRMTDWLSRHPAKKEAPLITKPASLPPGLLRKVAHLESSAIRHTLNATRGNRISIRAIRAGLAAAQCWRRAWLLERAWIDQHEPRRRERELRRKAIKQGGRPNA